MVRSTSAAAGLLAPSSAGPTPGSSWVDRLAATVGRLVGTQGAVFCFHGLDVAGAPSPSPMHLPLDLMDAILGTLPALGTVVPLRDVVSRHQAGRSTRGMVAVTADDGYASWLDAEPLLKRHGIPLTMFAVSDALDAGRTFWWDRVEDASSRATPERWRRFEEECGVPPAYRQGHRANGSVWPLRQWILATRAGRWPQALEEPLAHLERELGRRTAQRAMDATELGGFLSRTGADVAVHTVSHAALPFLPDEEIVTEVRRAYEALRERFRETRAYLAIPFGLFDPRTLRLAAEAGMTVSLTLPGCPLERPRSPDVGMARVGVVRQHTPGRLMVKASRIAGLLDRLRGQARPVFPALPSATT